MINLNLKARLETVADNQRRLQLWRGLSLIWVAAALLGVGFFLLRWRTGWSSSFTMPLLALAASLAALAHWTRCRKTAPGHRAIARLIEQEHPELNSLLLAATEQEPAAGRFNYLQDRVIAEALEHQRQHLWGQRLAERLFFLECAHLAALVLLVAVLVSLPVQKPLLTLLHLNEGVTVTPGDTTLERGSGLVVLARFEGRLPAEATLVIGPTAENSKRVPLVKNLEDPVFGGSVPEINSNVTYHVEYANARTPEFHVTVFEYPALQRADARLTYPAYTALLPKKIDDTRRVSAVEGTTLDYTFQLNKPVASARLVARDKSNIPLLPSPAGTNSYVARLTLAQSQRYSLQLTDDAGRTNKTPAEFVITVLKNRPPELKFAAPRGDQRVSPLEEIAYQAEAWDDFGLRAYGLAYTVAGQETKFLELGRDTAANEKRQFTHLLPLESLAAEPDQLISYFVWADDVGPDGQVRRTASDIYFAEVRPFEEIFREGESSEGESEGEQQQGQQRGSQATKLADLQKQIISATWNLQREHVGAPKTTTAP